MKKQWKWLILFMVLLFLPPVAAEAKTSARSMLNETEKAIYDILKPQIEEVAQNGGSTQFAIPADKFNYGQLRWTSEEASAKGINAVFQETLNKTVDIRSVLIVLESDLLFEMFWYSTGHWRPSALPASDNLGVERGSLTIDCQVISEYQDNQQNYCVSKEAVSKAHTAAANAQSIVDANARKSDYEKLLAYKNALCKVPFVEGESRSNVVHAFDNDASTGVVCEGYSKAFQYLCDLSDFASDKVQCRIVGGYLLQGDLVRYDEAHAWNLVIMDDGKNYLVDITNCRKGVNLFLRGASEKLSDGYRVAVDGGNISYRYGDSKLIFTPARYSAAELTLSETDYNMFTDVKPDSAFFSAIQWAVAQGITNGTSDTTFSPGNTCTTANIITFLWRANGSPAPSGTNPFSDVSSGSYYEKAAVWAYEKGIVSNKAFNGGSPCTRAATMKYLWILAGRPASGNPPFTDVSPGADYAQAISWAVAQGVTNGTTATTFAPDNTCTRGQIVTFLYRHYAQ